MVDTRRSSGLKGGATPDHGFRGVLGNRRTVEGITKHEGGQVPASPRYYSYGKRTRAALVSFLRHYLISETLMSRLLQH